MKNALIWAIDGDIGGALAQQLHDDDWTVLGTVHDGDNDAPDFAHTLEADVADAYAVQNAVMQIGRTVDEINLWVYAAGDIAFTKVADMDEDEWRRVIDANLSGAYRTIHHSLPLLSDDAHIVFVGAISERVQLPRLAAYAAAKAGLEAFADSLRKEERGRTVTVVRPGAVDTKFWERGPARLPADHLQAEDVARAILDAHAQKKSGRLDLVPEKA